MSDASEILALRARTLTTYRRVTLPKIHFLLFLHLFLPPLFLLLLLHLLPILITQDERIALEDVKLETVFCNVKSGHTL